jgi:hypothetical protein
MSDMVVDKFRYRGAGPGQVLVGLPDGSGYMEPGELADLPGHWEPLCDGDPTDPQPIYAVNADGVPDFLMMWFVP